MSTMVTEYRDLPQLPGVETHKAIVISGYSLTISGSQFLLPNHQAGIQQAWFVHGRNKLSWFFKCEPDGHRGATLNIHCTGNAEGNPALSTDVWRSYALFCGDTAGIPLNHMVGLIVPSLYLYFEIVTGESSMTLNGWLKLETP